jgi:hypothetical protein
LAKGNPKFVCRSSSFPKTFPPGLTIPERAKVHLALIRQKPGLGHLLGKTGERVVAEVVIHNMRIELPITLREKTHSGFSTSAGPQP